MGAGALKRRPVAPPNGVEMQTMIAGQKILHCDPQIGARCPGLGLDRANGCAGRIDQRHRGPVDRTQFVGRGAAGDQ
jgi:hypothetical protein